MIPSGTLEHSNTDIGKDESRYSFTQYAAGGLFRWVEHGFVREKDYKKGWSKAREEKELEDGKRRWEEGIALFSTLDELRAAHRLSTPSTSC